MLSLALDATVHGHARLVDEALDAFLPRADPGVASSLRDYLDAAARGASPRFAVHGPMRHVVAAGGKRIRPTLCLLAHEAAGGRCRDALPTAVGIELLHTFTLVHDDVMDRAPVRRARPTVGAIWGDDVAITVGDALFALALDAFASNADVPDMPADRVLRVLRHASQVALELAQGQTLDLLHARRGDVSVPEYLEMIRLKTGVLLEFSLASGAILAGVGDAGVRDLSRFGAPLGVAFQIRDDVLDLVGDPRRLGKPVGGDIRAGKRTLMVAHAFERSPRAAELARILDAPAAEKGDEDVARAIRILDEAGSIAYAQRVASEKLAEAKRALAAVSGHAGGLAALGALADYVIAREE